MRLLRSDLIIKPFPDGPGCRVYDQRSDNSYEFGEVEQCILDLISRPYQTEDILEFVNSRFGLEYTLEDIKEFLLLLEGWGLTSEKAEQADQSGKSGVSDTDISGSPTTRFNNDIKQPNRWHLFNPQSLFDLLGRVLLPFRSMVYLTPVVFAVGILALIKNLKAFMADLSIAVSHFGLLGRLVFAAFTVNLLTQVVKGIVARYHGLKTPSLGFLLLLGLVPRFNLQIVAEGPLSRQARLRLTSTAAILRLWLFALAVILWAITRTSGHFLPFIATEIVLISVISLFFVANPFWQGDGSNFLSALLDAPNIHKRSRNALRSFFFKPPRAISRHARYSLILGLMGLISWLLLVFIAGFIAFRIFEYLEHNYHGAGVSLFIILAMYISLSIYRRIRAQKKRAGAAAKLQPPGESKPLSLKSKTSATPGTPSQDFASHSKKSWFKKTTRFLLLVLVAICLFLPYEYETGGPAEIVPYQRAVITAEMDGRLDQVFFRGGEWVRADTPLARLSHHRQLKDLLATRAMIEGKGHEIDMYQTTPSVEEINLALARLETARQEYQYSLKDLSRKEQLFEQKIISLQEYENATRLADFYFQKSSEAEAELEHVKNMINPSRILSLESEINRLQAEKDFHLEQLERTYLRAPIDGRIITLDLHHLQGSYLEAGQEFAEIENISSVLLRTAVPEAEISHTKIDAPIRLRLSAYPDQEFLATIDEIGSVAEEREYGRVVLMTSLMDNSDGLFKSGLTGYVKIETQKMPVVLAFTKAFVRFIKIEAWSWIP